MDNNIPPYENINLSSPVLYWKNRINWPEQAFQELMELDWIRIDQTPRSEYYINDTKTPYTYGKGRGRRTYLPQEQTRVLIQLREIAEYFGQCKFEVCFLNRYLDGSDQLGWHSDDSPEMDDNRPIIVMSFGAEREIWFREIDQQAVMLRTVSKKPIEKLKLHYGSICLMKPGMQDTHQHRIPKADRPVGERISLTFRGYSPAYIGTR